MKYDIQTHRKQKKKKLYKELQKNQETTAPEATLPYLQKKISTAHDSSTKKKSLCTKPNRKAPNIPQTEHDRTRTTAKKNNLKNTKTSGIRVYHMPNTVSPRP